MSWIEMQAALMNRIPEEIKNDSNRLNDFMKGAAETYKLFEKLFHDDLR